jgi:hypothetical protein
MMCRGGVTAVAMGRIRVGVDGRWRIRKRDGVVETTHKRTHKQHNTTNTQVYPGSGPFGKVKPLLLHV